MGRPHRGWQSPPGSLSLTRQHHRDPPILGVGPHAECGVQQHSPTAAPGHPTLQLPTTHGVGVPWEGLSQGGGCGWPRAGPWEQGGPNSPPGRKAAAPGVASAQRSARCWPSPAHDGAGGVEGPPSGHRARSQTGKLRHGAPQPTGKQPRAAPSRNQQRKITRSQANKGASSRVAGNGTRTGAGGAGSARAALWFALRLLQGTQHQGRCLSPSTTRRPRPSELPRALGSPRDRQTGLVTYKIHLY